MVEKVESKNTSEIQEAVDGAKKGLKDLEKSLNFLKKISKKKKSEVLKSTVNNYKDKIAEIRKELRVAKRKGQLEYIKTKHKTIKELGELIKELTNATAKEKPLNSNEKYQKKRFEEQVKNNRLMLELTFLNSFNSASDKFQTALKDIIAGKRSANIEAVVFSNPNTRRNWDALYEESKAIPELHAKLVSVQKNSAIYAKNGAYIYTENGGTNTTVNYSGKKNTFFQGALDKTDKWGDSVASTMRERGVPEVVAGGTGGLVKIAPLIATGVIAWKTVKGLWNLAFKTKDFKSFGANFKKLLWPGLLMTGLFMDLDKLLPKLKEKGIDVKSWFTTVDENGKTLNLTKQEDLLPAALSPHTSEQMKNDMIYPLMGMNATMGMNYAQLKEVSAFDTTGKIKSVDYSKMKEIAKENLENSNSALYKKVIKAIEDAEKLKTEKNIDVVAKSMSDIKKSDLENGNKTKTTAAYFAQKIGEKMEKGKEELNKQVIENLINNAEKGGVAKKLGNKKEEIISKLAENEEYTKKITSGEWKFILLDGGVAIQDNSDAKSKKYPLDLNSDNPFENLTSWEDLNDRTKTKTKENLDKTNLPVAEKIAIQKTMNMLYEKVDGKAKANLKLNIDASGNITGLSSYGQEIKFDLSNKRITGLNMKFNTIDELFKTANLINKLKDIVKNKDPKHNRNNPFSTNWMNRLTFNDSDDPWYDSFTVLKNYWPFYHSSKNIAGELGTTEGMKNFTQYMNTWRNTEKDIYTNQEKFIKENKQKFDKISLASGEKVAMFGAIKKVYEKLPAKTDKTKAMKIETTTDGKMKFTTYEQEIVIDYKNKKIDGLAMDFTTFDELFLTANLINRIKDIAKTKTPGKNPDRSGDDRKSPFSLGKSNSLNFRSITDPWYDDLTMLNNYRPFYHTAKHTATSLGTTEGMKEFTQYMNTWRNRDIVSKYK